MEESKKKKPSLGARLLRWKLRLLGRGISYLFYHVVLPAIFVVTTAYVAYFHHEKIGEFYQWSPLLTVETIVAWFVLGLAWVIGENDRYKLVSTLLLIGGFGFATFLHYQQLLGNELMAVISGALALAFIIAWRASAGTIWWKFAQGKMATSDAETGNH